PRSRSAAAITAVCRLAGLPATIWSFLDSAARANPAAARVQPRVSTPALDTKRSSHERPQNGHVMGSPIATVSRGGRRLRSAGLIVFDIGETLVVVRRALERAALTGPPANDLLDLFRELEILVRHALGGVIRQAHL